jgi:V-type H+-transporting ATPase subunit E
MMSETSRFTEDILKAAAEKADKIIREAQAETQRASDEAKASISREAEVIIRSAHADAEAVKRRETSEARHKSKLREEREKDVIMTEVLDQAKKRVLDMAKDEDKYLPYLTNLVESAIRQLGDQTLLVHLNKADMARIDRANVEREIASGLKTPIKIEWSKEPIVAAGGAIVSSRDGKTRIVNTLDERFDALESKLLIEAGKSLFGQ